MQNFDWVVRDDKVVQQGQIVESVLRNAFDVIWLQAQGYKISHVFKVFPLDEFAPDTKAIVSS